jgi:hypothetical protein
VSYRTGFGFDARIYWTFIQRLQHFPIIFFDWTLSASDHTTLIHCSILPRLCLAKVKVMLRPTVSRPVCLEIKHPFGAYDKILIIVWQLRVCWFGAPSLTRGRVCRLQLLLVLASAVIFGSESRRTRGHILLYRLKFESYYPVHVGRPLWREVGSVVCQP